MKNIHLFVLVSILSITQGCATVDLGWYNEAGQQAVWLGNSQKATEHWEAGLAQARAHRDKYYIMTFLRNLGDIYRDQWQFQKTLETYEELLKLVDHPLDRLLLVDVTSYFRKVCKFFDSLVA